jgi:hypothetical protein
VLAPLAVAAALAGAPERCLDYGPHEVVLQGRLEQRVTGPTPRGTSQRPGTPYLVLALDAPVCVTGYPRGLIRHEEGLTVLQVSGDPEVIAQARVGRIVEARGYLYHRRLSQHFTRVLIHAVALDQADIFSK